MSSIELLCALSFLKKTILVRSAAVLPSVATGSFVPICRFVKCLKKTIINVMSKASDETQPVE